MNLKKAFLVAGKDLKIEFRNRHTLNFMFLFSSIVLLMFNFATDNPYSPAIKEIAPGFLWFILIFAGLLGISRAFIKEKELGTLEGLRLSPIGSSDLLFGKILYNLALMLIIEGVTFPLFIVLFNYQIAGSALSAVAVLTLGIVGFVILGSFLSAVILGAKGKELVLLIVVLPLLLPIIIPTLLALREVMLYGTALSEIREIKLLFTYIITMITLSLLLFDYVMEE